MTFRSLQSPSETHRGKSEKTIAATALWAAIAGPSAADDTWDAALVSGGATNTQGYSEVRLAVAGDFIRIPAVRFTMGNNDLSPRIARDTFHATPEHPVNLSTYWIAKTPVTIAQFRAFVDATGYVTDAERPGADGPWVYDFDERGFIAKQGYNWRNCFADIIARYPEIPFTDAHPVACVSWNDAIAFANWVGTETGLTVTLPSEAQWEYAARGADGCIYPWGNTPSDRRQANYADDSFAKYFAHIEQSLVHRGINDGYPLTSPVGQFPLGASPFGVLDMAGNLTEWVYDGEYDYRPTEQTDPLARRGQARMQKGGDWSSSAGRPDQRPDELEGGHNIRADARQADEAGSSDDHLGFRRAIVQTSR